MVVSERSGLKYNIYFMKTVFQLRSDTKQNCPLNPHPYIRVANPTTNPSISSTTRTSSLFVCVSMTPIQCCLLLASLFLVSSVSSLPELNDVNLLIVTDAHSWISKVRFGIRNKGIGVVGVLESHNLRHKVA